MTKKKEPTADCPVCARDDRDDVDERLAFDHETVTACAASTGLPVAVVWAHRNGHLDPEWGGLVAEHGGQFASSSQLKALAWGGMIDVRSMAMDSQRRDRVRVDAHQATRAYQEMLGDMVDDRPPSGFDELLSHPAIGDLLAIIRAAVAPFPGARAALDEQLSIEGTEGDS